MQTEDLLKVKFVLVCALASEVESGRHIGIPLEQLMEAIGITALPCPATAGSALLCNGRKSPRNHQKSPYFRDFFSFPRSSGYYRKIGLFPTFFQLTPHFEGFRSVIISPRHTIFPTHRNYFYRSHRQDAHADWLLAEKAFSYYACASESHVINSL